MKNLILCVLALFLSFPKGSAQVFTVHVSDGYDLYFSVTDTTKKTVKIVRPKLIDNTKLILPSGSLKIPASVKYKNAVYQVTSIGDNAFEDADQLTAVTIPSTVSFIGKAAFSGCSNLKSIVFPAIRPTMGSNVFDKCYSISDISFGSEWKSIELQMFASSVSLTSVFIPSRTVKITGVKQLPQLQEINVDRNNPSFSTQDGILYSKDSKTLYACPISYKGRIAVPEGTEKILDGAFRDCRYIVNVILPESVHELSFDEFSTCSSLSRIKLLSEVPPVTAKWEGASVFALMVSNPECLVYVPKNLLRKYRESICSNEGTYESLDGKRKVTREENVFLAKSNIQKIKKNN